MWINLWIWVGEGKNDRVVGHFSDHIRSQDARAGETKEEIGVFDDIIERCWGRALGVAFFLRRHFCCSAFVDEAFDIDEPDVFAFDAHFEQHVEAGDASGAAACAHNLDVFKALAGETKGVGGRGTDYDRGAVLIVVEHGDVHAFAAELFDDKAIGGLDIFEVDGAEGGFKGADDVGKLFGVGFVQFDVKTVDVCEFLEQDGFAFHHWFGGETTDIA